MKRERKSILDNGNGMHKGREMCSQSSAAHSAQLEGKSGVEGSQEALNAVPRIFTEGEQLEPQQDLVNAPVVICGNALKHMLLLPLPRHHLLDPRGP